MEILKSFVTRRPQQKPYTPLDDELVPRLVSKPKQHKKKNGTVSEPPSLRIPIEIFSQRGLPNIVLWPPTPPKGGPKVEDLLFERLGSVFILRGQGVQDRSQSTLRPGIEQLQVPVQSRIEKRHEKNTELLEQTKDAVELEQSAADLCYAFQSDYRTFMAGLTT